MKPTLLIFDSNYICYRAKFGMTAPLHSAEAQTHIIFNFVGTVLKLCEQFDANNVIFSFDSKISKRKEIYPYYKYKRNEPKTEEEKEENKLFFKQVTELRENTLPSLGFNNILFEEGFESDDLMHIFCEKYCKDYNIVMISSDKDMMQSLEYCDICKPVKKGNKNVWVTYTKEDFRKEWGIEPKQWGIIKKYCGCFTDKVIGIPGVKEKTAIKYYTNRMNPKTKTFRKILMLAPMFLERNEKLVALPFVGTPENVLKRNSISKNKFIDMCKKYDFRSYLGNFVDRWCDNFIILRRK